LNDTITNIKENYKENKTEPRRIVSVDALRGLSVLLMVFAAVIPFGVLPSWMYHAQTPPPSHHPVMIAGISWVDLIFPFFLFTMGIAIPLSLDKKLGSGMPVWRMILTQLKRSVLLAVFAIYIYHVNPRVINNLPDWKTWCLSLIGFILLFPVLGRFPFGLSNIKKIILQAAGIMLMAAYIAFLNAQGVKFSLNQSDIIILVLANVSFFGSIIWIVSKNNFAFRIGFIIIFIALKLSSSFPGWVHNLWFYSPVPWLWHLDYLKYLLIIIPGTIAGDLILKAQKNHDSITYNKTFLTASVLVLVLVVIVVGGLKQRIGFELFLLSASLAFFIRQLFLLKSGKNSLLTGLTFWGICWLIIGFMFEPYEGGIKKDPATISYYFITSGLASFVLAAFYILIDMAGKKKYFSLLVDSGRNPLIAYAGLNNLVYPLIMLLYIKPLLDLVFTTPWAGVVEGAIITWLLALSTRFFTKYKIYLTA
jgi:predicted acyltransferase